MEKQKIDDHIEKMFRQHEMLRKETNGLFSPLRIENIKQIRGLIKHWILISSGIVGLAVPMFSNSGLIKNQQILALGLLSLLLLVIFSFYYLSAIMARENRELNADHDLYNQALDEMRKNIITFALSHMTEKDFKIKLDRDQESLNKLNLNQNAPVKKDYMLDLIFYLFIIGLGSMVLSMTDLV